VKKDGERLFVEKHQRVLPWWQLVQNDTFAFFIRVGYKPMNSPRTRQQLALRRSTSCPPFIDMLIAAARNGETDRATGSGCEAGRKSYLFAGSHRTAERAAVMSTMIMTAKKERCGSATASISDFAEPMELLLFLPGACADSCTCTCARSCTCAPLLTSLVPLCTPILPPFHADGLGLGIGRRQCDSQCGSGCCDGGGGNFSEKRKSPSTGDRF
jgi:hypothetical protein